MCFPLLYPAISMFTLLSGIILSSKSKPQTIVVNVNSNKSSEINEQKEINDNDKTHRNTDFELILNMDELSEIVQSKMREVSYSDKDFFDINILIVGSSVSKPIMLIEQLLGLNGLTFKDNDGFLCWNKINNGIRLILSLIGPSSKLDTLCLNKPNVILICGNSISEFNMSKEILVKLGLFNEFKIILITKCYELSIKNRIFKTLEEAHLVFKGDIKIFDETEVPGMAYENIIPVELEAKMCEEVKSEFKKWSVKNKFSIKKTTIGSKSFADMIIKGHNLDICRMMISEPNMSWSQNLAKWLVFESGLEKTDVKEIKEILKILMKNNQFHIDN